MTQVEQAPETPAPPLIDVADDTYLRVAPTVLAPLVADSAWWIRWWPDLVPHVTRDRGVKGQQWTVTGALRHHASLRCGRGPKWPGPTRVVFRECEATCQHR